MKRIVVITSSFPRGLPGSEAAGSFVEDFCAQLQAYCSVMVVAPGSVAGPQRHGTLPVERFAAPAQPLSTLRWKSPLALFDVVRILTSGRAATLRAARALNPDYLFALWALPCGHWARSVATQLAIPYGVWCLGSDIWSLGKVPLVQAVLRTTLVRARDVFADGIELAADASRIGGRRVDFLPSSRLLPGSVAALPRATAPYRLAFLGRWHPNKGIDLLLEALAALPSSSWELIERVRIAGGGPLDPQVKLAVAALARTYGKVELAGYLDRVQAAAFIDDSDFVLLPSRIESIPVILSDALQRKRPVIATPVGDLPRLFTRAAAGVLATSATVQAYAAAIAKAISAGPTVYLAGVEVLAGEFDLAAVARRVAC